MTKAVFFSKKAKAKMRARRHKLMKARGGDGSAREREATAPNADVEDYNEQNERIGGRKRAADQISNSNADADRDGATATCDAKERPTKSAPTEITIPAGLTSKEAKKFRKDARRKARAEGRSDDAIKFVVEGQAQSTADATTEEGGKENGDSHGDKRNDDGNPKKNKKPKRSFPRINDLLSQHAAAQKLQQKLAKQGAADAALPLSERRRYVAVDCEMVGVGPEGRKSALARASAVDWDGAVLLDAFVRVPERVTDFRTHVSGVRPRDIRPTNEAALDPEEVRSRMEGLLHGKVLVGHALKNDLSALMLTHPREDTRDTARYKPFMRATGRSGGKLRPRKLRDLALEELGKRIQVEGEGHSSVEDARASMELFKVARGRWEKELEEKKRGKGGGRGRGEK